MLEGIFRTPDIARVRPRERPRVVDQVDTVQPSREDGERKERRRPDDDHRHHPDDPALGREIDLDV